MIEVKNLSKYYGDKPGVVDLSFRVNDGEVVGLLGPNGAGKSTLMKMLTGYHMPSSGEIYINGIDAVANPREAMRNIGFMPEIPPLYTDMATGDFLSFCAQIRGVKKTELKESVDRAMETAQVSAVSGRLIRNLSKGYRQRVGLAQALIGDPQIIIMDEPTVGLDPKQMAEFRQLMTALSEKHTIIISSHILSEINQICKRLIIINKGRLVASDTVEHLEDGLSQGDSFSVKLQASAERAIPMISAIDGVSAVHDRSEVSADKGCCYLTVEGSDSQLRARFFRACAQADMPILELNSQRLSLEQVFLQLTDSGEGGAQK